MIYVGVLGSTGRMGQTILNALQNHPRCRLSIAGRRDNVSSLFEQSDVIIDFTSPESLSTYINLAITLKKPLVIGTTGFQPKDEKTLSKAALKIPMVVAANMSVGITLLSNLVQQSANLLDETYDIEISEIHHRHKKDAPSGTSLILGNAAAQGRKKELSSLQNGPDRQGERHKGSIGFSVQRGGLIIGDHSVRFIDDEEMIELSHRGLSRNLYAKGALRAVEWVIHQNPGLYSMKDVLGL